MTVCNSKIHIICGACGCNTMLEFRESTIYCRNCSFVVNLSEVLPARVLDDKELAAVNSLQLKTAISMVRERAEELFLEPGQFDTLEKSLFLLSKRAAVVSEKTVVSQKGSKK